MKIRMIAASLLAMALCAGCAEEPSGTSVPGAVAPGINAEIVGAKTRTCIDPSDVVEGEKVPVRWSASDELGAFSDGGSLNVKYTIKDLKDGERNASFSTTSSMKGGIAYAYYPYSSENDGKAATSLTGTIPSVQAMDGNLYGDYKYGELEGGSDEAGYSFRFHNLFSMVYFKINPEGTALAGEILESVTLSVTRNGADVPVTGDFTFNAVEGTYEPGETSNVLNTTWNKPLSGTLTGFATIFSKVEKGDKLNFTFKTTNYEATLTVTSGANFQPGAYYAFPLTLSKFAGLKVYDSAGNEVDYESLLPTIESFSFDVNINSDKLLDNKLVWSSSKHTPSFEKVTSHSASIDNDTEEITLTIPYLYDFKLKPTFTVSDADCVVTVNGEEQVSEVSEIDFTNPVTYTVTKNSFSRSYTVRIINTGLPVVVINQSGSGDFSKKYDGGVELFGQQIGGTLVNQFVDFMIRGKETTWVTNDQITVYNPDGTIDCDVSGGVRLRGNTTQVYPKKPFAIKFNEKKPVLGMPEHKRWVLLANWLDHSMIRNSVAFDIAHAVEAAWRQSGGTIGDGIPWNVHGQNVELVFIENGEAHHLGNYFLCEQIKIDGDRLDIQDSYEDSSNPTLETCGYLLEFDMKKDTDTKYTTSNGLWVKFKDDEIAGTSIFTAVCKKIQGIEDNLDKGDYVAAYNNLDINSLVDQFLIWELTMNREYGDPGSVYMFMDGDGKLHAGPVWDFDRGTFQNQEKATSLGNSVSYRVKADNAWMFLRTQENQAYSYIWYRQLMKDATFKQTVQQRWKVIKPYLDMIPEQIRLYGKTQAASFTYNSAMWPTNKGDITKYKSDFKDWSGDEQIVSWNEVITNFVAVYQERLEGMNSLITSGQFTE